MIAAAASSYELARDAAVLLCVIGAVALLLVWYIGRVFSDLRREIRESRRSIHERIG